MSKYPQRVKRGLVIPWGYEQHPDDKQLLLPIDEQLDVYEEAKRLLHRGCTLRDVSEWMSATTGRYISHVGLDKKIKAEVSEKRRKAANKAWENRRARIAAAEKKLDGDQERSEAQTEA